MKKFLMLLCVVAVCFSCKSKKTVVTKKKKTKTERVVKNKEKETVRTTSGNTVSTTTYANATDEYIATYARVAVDEMERYNIPASITLAQGILESASGNGRLAKEANNHFGIKCHTWDGDRIYHDDDAAQECFRKYDDASNSFRDHSLFLSERSRYASLFKLKKNDYKGWAKGLKSAGYATDPKYPAKLISLIERYNLDKYDNRKASSNLKERNKIEVNAKTNVVSVREVPKQVTHVVVKGDTLYYISKMHNISVDELKALNDLEDNNIKIGQVLTVSPK